MMFYQSSSSSILHLGSHSNVYCVMHCYSVEGYLHLQVRRVARRKFEASLPSRLYVTVA